MAELQKLIWAAKRPIAILGGSRWSAAAVQRFARFAERFALPVDDLASAARCCSRPTTRPTPAICGLGPNPKLLARLKEADLVLLVGGRMSEMPSQSYTLFDIPTPRQPLVHVHPGLGRARRASTVRILRSTPRRPPSRRRSRACSRRTRSPGPRRPARRMCDFLAWSDPAVVHPPGRFQMNEVMAHLRRGAAGRHHHLQRRRQLRDVGAPLLAVSRITARSSRPTSGSMGYGVPAASARSGSCRTAPSSASPATATS